MNWWRWFAFFLILILLLLCLPLVGEGVAYPRKNYYLEFDQMLSLRIGMDI